MAIEEGPLRVAVRMVDFSGNGEEQAVAIRMKTEKREKWNFI
jgi:hypothetical protein